MSSQREKDANRYYILHDLERDPDDDFEGQAFAEGAEYGRKGAAKRLRELLERENGCLTESNLLDLLEELESE